MTDTGERRAMPVEAANGPLAAAAAEDAAARAALAAGGVGRAISHLRQAERHAVASGDRELLLRQLVRTQAIEPIALRQRTIGAMQPRVTMAELVETHAADLLPPPRAAAPPPQAVPALPREMAAPKPAQSALLAAAVAAPVTLALAHAMPGGVLGPAGQAARSLVARLPEAAEGLIGTAFGVAHLAKVVLYDPISRTVAFAGWASAETGADILAAEAARLASGSALGIGLLGLLALLATALAVHLVSLHAGRALHRAGERLIFDGRRRWYSYHRRLLWPSLFVLGGVLAHEAAQPSLAIPFDIAACIALLRLAWLAVPGARPRLLVTERPGEPRQTRIELLAGVAHTEHLCLPIYELHAASLAPTPWWSPTQDILLRRPNGGAVLLAGFAGRRRAMALVAELNRLMRSVPPMPFQITPR